MTTETWHHDPAGAAWPRWLVIGFISGFVSVLLFHQGTAALLHALGITPRAPYSLSPTAPLGVPQLWSLAFWGGLWGIALAASLARLAGAALILGSVIFGVVFPTLVAWLIVAPLKGQPLAAGGVPSAMAVGLMVNGAWGLGAGIGLALFGRAGTTNRTGGMHPA